MGLKVTIRMPEDIIDNKISKLENDIAKAKKAGKNTEAMEKRLNGYYSHFLTFNSTRSHRISSYIQLCSLNSF